MTIDAVIAVPVYLLLGVLVVAVASDIRSRRIPNSLILAGWALAFGWHIFGPRGAWTFDPVSPGAVGVLGASLGLAALLLAFMPFYMLRIMGAGDVKLMSVVGAFFGASSSAWTHLVGVSLIVLAAGGVLSIIRMLVSRRSAAVLGNLRLMLAGYSGRLTGTPGPVFDARTDSADRMPYAVAIATGTTFYVVAKWAGWMKWL